MRGFLLRNYHQLWWAHAGTLLAKGRLSRRIAGGRVACLGKEIFSDWSLLNQQKSRIDVFLSNLEYRRTPRYEAIAPFIKRDDLLPIISQQCTHVWERSFGLPGNLFIMDSFSELTDQEFVHREEQWSFCANYGDINHNAEFEKLFESKGLLPIEGFQGAYEHYFSWLFSRNSGLRIIYIHFPTVLDARPLYRERGRALREAIALWENRGLINIYLGDDAVLHADGDDLPYHYSKSTIAQFREVIAAHGIGL